MDRILQIRERLESLNDEKDKLEKELKKLQDEEVINKYVGKHFKVTLDKWLAYFHAKSYQDSTLYGTMIILEDHSYNVQDSEFDKEELADYTFEEVDNYMESAINYINNYIRTACNEYSKN